MKRIIAIIMALMLSVVSVFASNVDVESEVVKALGIMTGYNNGDMKLDREVSRAEFAKMSVVASPYKNDVAKSAAVSLFKDLRHKHWAVPYVKLALENKWFHGYADGTFRPNSGIKYEEGITVLLRILGYSSDKLKGVYPNAQITKANEIGLSDNVGGIKGQKLTRAQCKTLFYNLLSSKNVDGQVYGESVNVPIKAGKVDYLALVYSELEGPFVYENTLKIPFENPIIYKNGEVVKSLQSYDVYYYNKGLRKVFAYDKKIAGRVDVISPNNINPDRVILNGKEYELSNFDSKYAFSSFGKYRSGSKVTMLLGLNDKVVRVLDGKDLSFNYLGVVLAKERVSKDLNSRTEFFDRVDLLCTDGVKRSFFVDSTSVKKGDFANAKIEESDVYLEKFPKSSLRGEVAKDKLAGISISRDINVLEYYNDRMERLDYSELVGLNLSGDDVLYYAKDKFGNISDVVLNNISGDLMTYGYLLKGENHSGGFNGISSSYEYLVNGELKNISSYDFTFKVDKGGIVELKSLYGDEMLKNLKSTRVIELRTNSVLGEDKSITLDNHVQAYMKDGEDYKQVNINGLSVEKHNLTAYYSENKLGDKVRIIIANKKR